MTAPVRVYFHLEPDVAYEDGAAYLAEGLVSLGVECFGTRNLWPNPKDSRPTIARAELGAHKWAAVFLTDNAYRYDSIDGEGRYHIRYNIPDTARLAAHAGQVVLINLRDGHSTLGEDDPNIARIFRAKFNERCAHSPRTTPYVLGVQHRVLAIPPRAPDSRENHRSVLDTFGFTHPYQHPTRRLFAERIAPLLESNKVPVVRRQTGSLQTPPEEPDAAHWWRLTAGKHNPGYYDLIRRHPLHACFCGEIVPSSPLDPSPLLLGGNRARLHRVLRTTLDRITGRDGRLIQWDSWRFWETLALGSVPLMFDLEKLGIRLPVMPVNWRHYVGLDPRSPEVSVDELVDRWAELPRIAEAGRRWLLDHYVPVANARRVLHVLGLHPGV